MAPPLPLVNRLSKVQLFIVKLTNGLLESSLEATLMAPPLSAPLTFVNLMFLKETAPSLMVKMLMPWPFPSIATFPFPKNAKCGVSNPLP